MQIIWLKADRTLIVNILENIFETTTLLYILAYQLIERISYI